MKTKQFTKKLNQVLTLVLTIAALAVGQSAWAASTFTIDASYNSNTHKTTFTITRTGNTALAETIDWRVVSLSAIAGQHFTVDDQSGYAGTATFSAGTSTASVTISENTPGTDAYKYQTGTERTYRFEVLDRDGYILASKDRSMTTGTSVPSSGLFNEKEITIFTTGTQFTDAGYDQSNNPHYIESSAYYNLTGIAPKAYYTLIGAQLRSTLSLEAREENNGYQYVQILINNISTCDYRSGCSNGDPGNINLSRYMAGFDHEPSSANTNYATYTFPVTSQPNNCSEVSNAWSNGVTNKLYTQKFNTNCRATDGRLILPLDFEKFVVRFNASGGGSDHDEWLAKNVKAHIQAVDATRPTVLNNFKVSGGRHQKGAIIYVTVPFSEIVVVTGTPTLNTSWGNFDYYAGSGTNVLTFRGEISSTADGTLYASGIGTSAVTSAVKDLAGNNFTPFTHDFGPALDTDYAWTTADFNSLGGSEYEIASKIDLRHLALLVNKAQNNCIGLTFQQTQDITCDNTYTPIGYYVNSSDWATFRGTYDGQSHTVSGITVTRTGDTNADGHVGLFGYIRYYSASDYGTVRNVVLASSTFTGCDRVGGIVGYNSGGTVQNCRVESTVTIKAGHNNAYYHGGIVGSNDNGNIIGCYSAAAVSANGKTNCKQYGGIVGYNIYGTVKDCLYAGTTVTADNYKGAIVGYDENNNGVFSNNYYTAINLGGINSADQNGARRARIITLGENIALEGNETAYNLSGLTAIGTTALRSGNTLYSGATQTLTLSYTGTPAGYAPIYSATAGTVNGNILVMSDEDVTVSAILRLAIPYSYGFEEEWSWNEWINLSGSNERVQGDTHTGNYKLLFEGSTNNIVVLPQFQYEANTLQVNFWSRPESYLWSKCGTFSVGYLTDPADASTFVALKTYNYSDWTANEYLQKTVYLNNVPDGARIAFRHNPEYDNWYWYVDDVEVSLLPSCIPPVDLAVSGIGASAATFSWDAAEGAEWEYGIVANAAQNYVPTDADFTGTTTANSVTLNTLSQLTSYTFYLRRACSAQDKSAVASVSFSTTQAPVAVPFSDDFEGNACQWVLENGNAENQWYWGTAASCGGTKALYISNDGGNSNSFSTNSSATVYATKMFTFADGDYYFSYNWRYYCYDGGQNYMRVALAPASASLPSFWSYPSNLPDGWIALDGGYTLNSASRWRAYQSDAITIPAGQYKMVVVWTNSNNTSPQTYPAAIDNISISTGIKTFTTAGSWNEASNWSPEGVPASTEHVRINAAATIPSGYVAEAAGIVIDYNNGSLTLADGGQLVCYHELSVTVQKAIAAYTTAKNGWNLFAMPFFTGQHPNIFNGLIPSEQSTVYDLYHLKEYTTYWENYKQHGSYFYIHPINGNGACLYATSVGTTLQCENWIYPNSVAGVTAYLSKQGDGWNLIANPYTCNAYVNKPFFRMNAEGSALEYVANYWETPLNVCEGIVVKADENYETVTFTRTAPEAPSSTPATMPDILLQLPSTHGFGEDNAAVTIISDNADNADVIAANQGSGRVVILSGRTLWKDGDWNTLCLPFSLSAEQIAASNLAGADIRTLSSSSFANGTLTLNFTPAAPTEGAVTSICAGVPYIIKWDNTGNNLVNPTFSGVTISSGATANVETTYADFKGTYSPIVWETENTSILFVGAGNTLYYPKSGAHINAQRAYFQLKGITASEVQNARMNFEGEDEVNGVNEVIASLEVNDDSWYTVDGRKLSGKPTAKGLYIHNGNKVVIK